MTLQRLQSISSGTIGICASTRRHAKSSQAFGAASLRLSHDEGEETDTNISLPNSLGRCYEPS